MNFLRNKVNEVVNKDVLILQLFDNFTDETQSKLSIFKGSLTNYHYFAKVKNVIN
jgi:hypothetical protein